jgi:hypothetical protein
VTIRRSENIDAPSCTACANRRPWDDTIKALEACLKARNVSWPNFVVMHGKDLECDAALARGGRKDAGLYVVATDPRGVVAKQARVFNRVEGYYVGVRAVLNGTAF